MVGKKYRRRNRQKRKHAFSYQSAIHKVGSDGRAVGRAGEERVLKAFLHINPKYIRLPSWWRGIRMATPEEDARGIDHVVHTDSGDIFIQIKTSLHKDTDRWPKRNDRDVAIVYINLKDSDAEIRKRVLKTVMCEHKRVLFAQKPKTG